MTTRELLFWDDDLYRALKRRAKRNYRTVRAEIAAILREALAEELETLRAERAAEQPNQPKEVNATP